MAVKISRRLMNRPANISAFLLAGFLPLQVFALPALYQQQQPLVVGWDTANSSWTDPSHVDETGNLIFRSVNGLLRHAPNALYRNGHSIVPGTVTPGTLLYHGTRNILGPPAGPEWVSFDPEHSYMFGMRLYTWVVQTPLKILYLDGSSAANMESGTIDTQEILLHGELRPRGWMSEREHIQELCQWGRPFGLNGFVRMEFDFEIMICDFSVDLELVSGLDLIPRGGPRRGPQGFDKVNLDLELDIMTSDVEDEDAAAVEATSSSVSDTHEDRREPGGLSPPPQQKPPFPPPGRPVPVPAPPAPAPPGWVGSLRPIDSILLEAVQSGIWHDLPGLTTSVKLDFSRLVTFFDPKFESLVIARRQQTRGMYRVGNVTRDDAAIMQRDLEDSLREDRSDQRKASGLDWTAITQAIVERHAGRFEYLLLLLDDAASSKPQLKVNLTESAIRIRWQVLTMLTPYMLATSVPPPHRVHNETVWLAPTVEYCSAAFTSHLHESASWSAPELLIKEAVQTVMHEICRTLGMIWLDAFDVEEVEEDRQRQLIGNWRDEVRRLRDWLGWFVWSDSAKCEPACNTHEVCTLPQWPFDMHGADGGGEQYSRPFCMSRWFDKPILRRPKPDTAIDST